MKGWIFNTPFYTKTDWHTGRLILSRNGQTKGFGEPGTMKYDRRVTFGEAGHEAAGVTGTTSFHGKRVGMNALRVMDNALARQTFGGDQKKKEMREIKIQASGQKLQKLMAKVMLIGTKAPNYPKGTFSGNSSPVFYEDIGEEYYRH